jgi:hypothetical protein
VHRKGKQFLLHMWHPSYYYCYKPGDKSWMRKGLGSGTHPWSFVTHILSNGQPQLSLSHLIENNKQ